MSGRNMHVEIQVALNFLISFLYNKLPRRRVNQFGEELEKALKEKFQGHWYPEKPYKGSAFRCLKTAPPLEPVFEVAARESGMDLADIQENLPRELSIWVDPGEVSYRMGEKLPVKILYSDGEKERSHEREVARTFNPEAQCFKPIDSLSSQLAGLGLQQNGGGASFNGNTSPTESSGSSPISPGSPGSSSPTQVFGTATGSQSSSPNSPTGSVSPPNGFNKSNNNNNNNSGNNNNNNSVNHHPHHHNHHHHHHNGGNNGGSPGSTTSSNDSSPGCGPASFLGGKTPALTFTTAAFAQTKFGSTKLKTSSKRSHRMSPTEFSAYIKQRAMLQQQQQQQQQHSAAAAMFVAAAAASSAAAAASNQNGSSNNASNGGRPRSLSPLDPGYLLMGPQGSHHHHQSSPFASNNQNATMGGNGGGGNSARSFGVFDHGYLGDLFAAAAANSKLGQRSPAQTSAPCANGSVQQQGHQLTSRFSPYHSEQSKAHTQLDAYAIGQSVSGHLTGNPVTSSPSTNSVTAASGSPGGANNAKNFQQPLVDGVTFNLNVGPYPNQYQHLLVAN